MAKAKSVSVQADLQEKLFVKANRESLMQLVSILMDNAVRYTPVNGTISVLLQKKRAWGLLSSKEYAGQRV